MRGGYRPGAGRPKGSKDKKPRKRKITAKKPKKTRKSAKKQETSQPKSDTQDRIKKLVEHGLNAKAKMYSDLLNKLARFSKQEPGATDLTIAEKRLMVKLGEELSKTADQKNIPDDIKNDAKAENLSPLEYMLKVINDPQADLERKDKLAIAAAPFFHDKPGRKGKKEEREDRAKKAGAGKFSPGRAPMLKAVK